MLITVNLGVVGLEKKNLVFFRVRTLSLIYYVIILYMELADMINQLP
jgi:hypothetical protein